MPGRIGTGFTDDLIGRRRRMLAGHALFSITTTVCGTTGGATITRWSGRPTATSPRHSTNSRSPARGAGHAWDGLSKYDLTKFNPWYWQRLRDFAELCDERGLVLIHQNYFQHNILEAGAHWADSPWRPANNVNDTGLPEPPPYIGDKRIFMAQQFYDVTDPSIGDAASRLHPPMPRQLRDCSNVIQMTSAEYSGPLEFTQFWLDTIIEWEREHGRERDSSASVRPKNVQDAILADPQRGTARRRDRHSLLGYTADGGLYAPAGGQNLAPRQHLRQTTTEAGRLRRDRQGRARISRRAIPTRPSRTTPT